jgi:uncharacterized lipoprotein NlpE involved in copper resistance
MDRKEYVLFTLIITLVIFMIGSCFSNRVVIKDSNSRDSLDWNGVYTGIVPSASGTGIYVSMSLEKDQSFDLSYNYLDRPEDQFNWTGSFKWDDTGSIITLDIIGVLTNYRVSENKLIQLDIKGKQISGKFADNYVLRKELVHGYSSFLTR